MNPEAINWEGAKANADSAPENPGLVDCALKQPKISVSWRDHNFDRFRKGATLLTQELVITSSGDKDLANISVTVNGDQFKAAGAAATLAPGLTTTVTVTFEPTAYGEKTATIRISSNAVNENPIDVTVKGKQYSVIAFIVEEDPGGAKIENVKLKIKQKDEPEQEVTTVAGGKVEFETEKDGNFEVALGDWESVLEFRSLTTA